MHEKISLYTAFAPGRRERMSTVIASLVSVADASLDTAGTIIGNYVLDKIMPESNHIQAKDMVGRQMTSNACC